MQEAREIEFVVAAGFEGMTVSGLFIETSEVDDDGETQVQIRGELGGLAALPEDAVLSCIINDGAGRVVGKSDHYVTASSYVGFEVFEFHDFLSLSGGIGRIRLVLKQF